jgi:hypothetical protein
MNWYRVVPQVDNWQELDHRVYFKAFTREEAIEYAKDHYQLPDVEYFVEELQ